jgi:peptidyl-prolyl cis-trans isomerase SurA
MHQAIQDSVKVTDAEVKGMMEERLSYMVTQIGSLDKVKSITRKIRKKN